MDKYIDDFCEEYFSEFEQPGIKCCTDALFNNQRMRPFLFARILVIVAIAIIGASFIIPFEVSCKSNILKDLGVGILSSALVSMYFILREKSIQYYKTIIAIIKRRIRSGEDALHKANRHIMNDSNSEGLQLLQLTAQNLFGVVCYFQDKLPNMFPASLNKDIVVELDIEGELSDEEIWQHVQNARRTIKDLLRCLGEMKRNVKKCM